MPIHPQSHSSSRYTADALVCGESGEVSSDEGGQVITALKSVAATQFIGGAGSCGGVVSPRSQAPCVSHDRRELCRDAEMLKVLTRDRK